ncbi:MAG TPA: hypothetical protein DDY91_03070 [Planctomycetaceae bacterium]|nr:hypothetical protein [Planctomycetaceae bacterium]
MPVKVRCPGCRKVLTAPDAARGKALKCPDCETKVRIPAGEGGGTGSTNPKTGQEDENLLAKLDLSKAVDTETELCPKCGADIPEGARECPKCGTDPSTGQLSKEARRRKSLKGVDPQEFYKVVWRDAWDFTLENFASVLQTAFYLFMFSSLAWGCFFMVGWCSDGPPKTFWGFLGVLCSFVFPGWLFHLNVETIKLTTVKKTSLKDVKFDMFTSIALGIKYVVWTISHIWMPFGFLAYPISMIHFSMPVPYRAWLAWVTMGLALKHFGAVLLYFVMRFLWTLPVAIPAGIVGAMMGNALLEAMQNQVTPQFDWIRWTVLGVCAVFAALCAAFGEVFLARVLGLMAYYFRDTLDLQTVVAEKVYQKKEVKLDKFGNPIQSPMQKYGSLVFAIVAITLTSNVIYYFYTNKQHVLLPDSWARAMGIID